MTDIRFDADARLSLIQDRRIAIIGYGNQGRAHAHNLQDSGCEVRIGARQGGSGAALAEADGFQCESIEQAAGWADVISVMLPDQVHGDVFRQRILPELDGGNALIVAHGFSLLYGEIVLPGEIDGILVAPVSPGETMRRLYLEGSGVPAVTAVAQDSSGLAGELALAYAAALGCGRVGIVVSTLREETETDLFGEQAILCGGVPALLKAGYDTLVEAGYAPEIAYFECVHQVKLIVDLIYESGLRGMYERISDTAEYGAYLTGPRVVDERVRTSLHAVLDEIRSGDFARRWIAEFSRAPNDLDALRQTSTFGDVDAVGNGLRSLLRPGDA